MLTPFPPAVSRRTTLRSILRTTSAFLSYLVSPRSPPIPADPTYFHQSQTSVGGWAATLSVPKGGLGPFRVDWVDADGYHTVLCDRAQNPEGLSGVDAVTIQHVASSLYPTGS